ncbi:hypothetical protein [Prosthecobacter sp.]|uniref:hypothetical protein n=1 Tax=Prosthecobacter sp. TaxID=1965333 RepID=UPI003782DF82
MQRLTLLLLVALLFEVVALHLNRRQLHMAVREIRENQDGSRRLVCELINDRITPVRYLAVNDHLPAYEMMRDGRRDLQTWCTSTMDHWVAPFGSVKMEIPVPKRRFHDCRISVMCEGTSLLSWLLWPSDDFERASVWGMDDVMSVEGDKR